MLFKMKNVENATNSVERPRHFFLTASRGVQYMHWVMHKCIMVKVGGKRNTQKVCKKQVNFDKTEGKFRKVGGNNNFRETGGRENVLKQGNSKFVVDDEKKGHQKFRRMKIKKFVGKK